MPVQAVPWSSVMPYLVAGIRAYVAGHPGALRAYARAGRSLVPDILAEYGRYLDNPALRILIVPWRETLRQAVTQDSAAVVAGVLQSLQAEPGELGEVARTHSAWVTRELLQLAREVGRRL